jgi:hypothetical protein
VSFSQVKPSGTYTQTQNSLLAVSYPDNWKISAADNGQGLTIAPPAGMSQGAVAYGVVINALSDPNASSLDGAANNLVAALQQSNPGLRASGSLARLKVNGIEGRSIELLGNSPIAQSGKPVRERDWLIALPRPSGGLLYLVFIAPDNTFAQLRSTFQRMLQSTQLR